MAMHNAKKHRGSHRFIIMLFIIIMFATFAAIFFPYFTNNTSSDNFLVDIPTISTIMVSKDGTSHSVQAKFTLEMGKNLRNKVDLRTLEGKITDIMSKLDYDKINDGNTGQYIKNSIKAGLQGYIGQEDLEGIYITDFQSGDSKIMTDELPGGQRNSVIKGLFKGTQR